jgi:hypothetical protein
MNRVLKSLLVAGACAFGLTACATYDYGYSGYSYSQPYYGYGYDSGYTPYAYDYYGYGPYYGYAPGYYVGPSVGLGFTFHDRDRHDGRDFHRDNNNRFHGDRRGSDHANRGGRDTRWNGARANSGQPNFRDRQATRAAAQPTANPRGTSVNESRRATRIAPVHPDAQRSSNVARAQQRAEMRAEQ